MTILQGAQVRLAPELAKEYPGIAGAYFNKKADDSRHPRLIVLVDVPNQPVLAEVDSELVSFKGSDHCSPERMAELLKRAKATHTHQYPALGRR